MYSCKESSGEKKYANTPTTGNDTIAVDATFQPIIGAVLPVFHAVYKYSKIDVLYLPEVDVLNLLLKDSVRFVIAARPLNENENLFFNDKKIFPKQLKIALDGVAILVNASNNDTLYTTKQLADILLGNITDWNQINPQSNLGKMRVIFDNPNSSIVRFMVDSITRTGNLGSHLTAMKTNSDVIDFVSKTPNAIGLIGVSWVSDKDDPACLSFLENVNVAAISRADKALPENSYQPFQAYIATGNYPLTRFVYMINAEPRVGLVTGFSGFVASDKGQRIILKTGVLPFTQPVRLIHVNN
jgi:phosphate transport system substrate-binding protein